MNKRAFSYKTLLAFASFNISSEFLKKFGVGFFNAQSEEIDDSLESKDAILDYIDQSLSALQELKVLVAEGYVLPQSQDA